MNINFRVVRYSKNSRPLPREQRESWKRIHAVSNQNVNILADVIIQRDKCLAMRQQTLESTFQDVFLEYKAIGLSEGAEYRTVQNLMLGNCPCDVNSRASNNATCQESVNEYIHIGVAIVYCFPVVHNIPLKTRIDDGTILNGQVKSDGPWLFLTITVVSNCS